MDWVDNCKDENKKINSKFLMSFEKILSDEEYRGIRDLFFPLHDDDDSFDMMVDEQAQALMEDDDVGGSGIVS